MSLGNCARYGPSHHIESSVHRHPRRPPPLEVVRAGNYSVSQGITKADRRAHRRVECSEGVEQRAAAEEAVILAGQRRAGTAQEGKWIDHCWSLADLPTVVTWLATTVRDEMNSAR